MSEFELRGNYLISSSYPVDPIFFEENIYKLITIFGSSEFLFNNFKEDSEYFFERAKEFEISKASEILISLAVMSRSFLDSGIISKESCKKQIVGKIIVDKKNKPLNFRDSCNKIIHAESINFDISNSKSIKDGFLNPIVYLYGEYQDSQWKAIVNIIDFCKAANDSF